MSQNNPPNNPYAKASRQYDTSAKNTTANPREIEARALLRSNKQMQALQAKWDSGITAEELTEVLTFNRQIWMMFVDTAIENTGDGHSIELRNNIANLGAFIFKHTIDVLASPKKEKLDILIELNREIAGGLLQSPTQQGGQPQPSTQQQSAQQAPAPGGTQDIKA
jgi:flagellar protein FlaF